MRYLQSNSSQGGVIGKRIKKVVADRNAKNTGCCYEHSLGSSDSLTSASARERNQLIVLETDKSENLDSRYI